MLISGVTIDDFKTERKDLMPPLAPLYRLVPILFYLSLVFLVVVGSLATWHSRVASLRYQGIVQQTATYEKDIQAAKVTRSTLEKKYRESENLERWVLASRPLQPLVVAIIRSMQPDSVIVDLTVERDAETPSQLKLSLTVNTDSDTQIDATIQAIRAMNYLEFSPTQTKDKGNIEYRATLLWRDPQGGRPTPTDRGLSIHPATS